MNKIVKNSLLVVGGCLVAYTFYFLWKQSQPKVVTYELQQPEVRTLQKKTLATGKVEPRDEVNIKPQIQGIITELYRKAGDRVQAGDPIAKVAVIPDMNSLAQAQSQVRTTQLTLEETEREFKRVEQLYNKGVTSREEYEQSQNQLAKAQESAKAAQDGLCNVLTEMLKNDGAVNIEVIYKVKVFSTTDDGMWTQNDLDHMDIIARAIGDPAGSSKDA